MLVDNIHHFVSGNPSGPHPSDPVPQTVGRSLQLGCYEPDHEALR
jgi:hypothetical protein